MKKLIISLLVFIPFFLIAQNPHLDVLGDTKIVGRIDISHPNDTNTVLIGRNAGLNVNALSGRNNTFVGSNAGRSNIDGFGNSFFGEQAGLSNTSGSGNSFFGVGAGRFTTTSEDNSFFGRGAGFNNTVGQDNSFFGFHSGYYNTNGKENSFFGRLTGTNNTSGTRNTFIGAEANSLSFEDSLDRAIAIGYNAIVDCHRCAVIGGTGENAVKVGIGIVQPAVELDVEGSIQYTGTIMDVSDIRLKENILSISDPLSKVQSLRGFSYNLIGKPDRSVGVSAQDVKTVLPEAVAMFDGEHYGVDYTQLVPLLIEAIKEQQQIIEAQEHRIQSLELEQTEVADINARLVKLEKNLR